MVEQIGIKFRSVEEYAKLRASLLKNVNFYSCIPFSSLNNSLYSSVLFKDEFLPEKLAVLMDISEINDDNVEIIQYLSLKIILFTAEPSNNFETAIKILEFTSKVPNLLFIYLCEEPQHFIDLHILCNYSPKLSCAINFPLEVSKYNIIKTLNISNVFLQESHFNQNNIQEKYVSILEELTEREIPAFISTDLSNFETKIANLYSKFDKISQKTYKYTLSNPLQPLANQLTSSMYQVFESDHTKYDSYQMAIEKAIKTKGEKAIVAVVGAGRGPLVDRALKAGATNIYVIEKNHAASVLLRQRLKKDWPSTVSVFEGDMREIELPEKVDILVSELLGGIGDNELSPECLFGCNQFLNEGAISIPTNYTSFLCPISSHHLWSMANSGDLDTMYVVTMNSAILASEEKELFSFTHPSKDCSNFYTEKVLNFQVNDDLTIHGFAGWFTCQLYQDVNISNSPYNPKKEVESWFQIFIPIKKPIFVKKGDSIKLWFSRRTDESRVWYEWSVLEPELMPIQNSLGRSYSIGPSAH